jgi:hypothetical protein
MCNRPAARQGHDLKSKQLANCPRSSVRPESLPLVSFMSQTTDWSMIGVFVGAAGLIATLITLGLVAYDVFRPERRKRKLKRPGTSCFIVPDINQHDCSYAHQNETEHRVREIIIPPHRTAVIDIAIVPELNFNTSQLILACEEFPHNNDLTRRPK